jgi:hypothetical protein
LQDGLKDLQAEHLRADQLDGYAVDLDEVAPRLDICDGDRRLLSVEAQPIILKLTGRLNESIKSLKACSALVL